MGKTIHKEGKMRGIEGTSLFYQTWQPEKISRIFCVAHGVGEHSGRYMNLVHYFLPLNYAVYALDHRGHGRSGGQRGHVKQFSHYVDDFRIFVQLVKEAHPGIDIFIVGHSMGGLIALAYCLEYPATLKGAIISSPGLAIKVKVPAIKQAAGKLCSSILPWLAMANGLPVEALSHDKDVIEQYKADPLVHDRVTARWFTEFLATQDYVLDSAKRFKLPVLIMHAGEDGLADPDGSRLFYKKLQIEDKELKIYEGFYHELFNEISKSKVFDDMKAWLERH
ncbi:lysophospholipase [candidate division KSB1 bacterium]|nr:lysophospholipase [candidate division KSB1 bacterium]